MKATQHFHNLASKKHSRYGVSEMIIESNLCSPNLWSGSPTRTLLGQHLPPLSGSRAVWSKSASAHRHESRCKCTCFAARSRNQEGQCAFFCLEFLLEFPRFAKTFATALFCLLCCFFSLTCCRFRCSCYSHFGRNKTLVRTPNPKC